MNNAQIKLDDLFGDIKSKDSFSQEQMTKAKIFLTKICKYNYKY